MGGLWGRLRYLPGVMLFFSVASLGMPGTGNFVGEFLILIGSFQVAPVLTIIATFGLVLVMMMTIAGLLVLLGVYPQPVLDTAGNSLLSVLHWYALPFAGALQ